MAGIFASQQVLNQTMYNLPETTANGALINYISQADWKDFKPTKFTFGLLPDLKGQTGRKIKKKLKKELKARAALESLEKWIKKASI
jgi:methylenetetrahydrofolate--tRNA-(uracil-5-)-methyltransferase